MLITGESDDQSAIVLLVQMKLYPGGRLDVRPGLNEGAEEAAAVGWYAVPGTRYDYRVENMSELVSDAAVLCDGYVALCPPPMRGVTRGNLRDVGE